MLYPIWHLQKHGILSLPTADSDFSLVIFLDLWKTIPLHFTLNTGGRQYIIEIWVCTWNDGQAMQQLCAGINVNNSGSTFNLILQC